MTIKERVLVGVAKLIEALPTPRKDNRAKVMQDVLVWQELSSASEKKLKEAWKAAQDEGITLSDDDMRDLGEGDHVVDEAGDFSVLAKVSVPRKSFDLALFVAVVAKRHKLKVEDLMKIAERCRTEGKPSLTKRVLEVE